MDTSAMTIKYYFHGCVRIDFKLLLRLNTSKMEFNYNSTKTSAMTLNYFTTGTSAMTLNFIDTIPSHVS